MALVFQVKERIAANNKKQEQVRHGQAIVFLIEERCVMGILPLRQLCAMEIPACMVPGMFLQHFSCLVAAGDVQGLHEFAS
jgi:hypothetical protein